MKVYNITEIIKSPYAVSPTKGLSVYEEIVRNHLKKGDQISLSFKGIEDLTSAFCNALVGKAYLEFGEKRVDSLLSVIDLRSDENWMLKIDRAKQFAINAQFGETVTKALEQLD